MTPTDLLIAITDIDEEDIFDAKNLSANKKSLSRRGVVVLIAAVMLLTALAITASANPDTAAWFRQFFRDSGKQELSQGQVQYIDENTVEQKQSQTQNGYTVTVESAISDGANAYVLMTLTAPENVILDADYYSLDTRRIPRNEAGETFSGGSCGWSNEITDENKQDNVVTLLYTMDLAPGFGEKGSFNDHIWTIRLEDLTAAYFRNWNTPDFTVKQETIAQGIWEFQVQFADNSRSIQMIREPVPCPAEVRQWPELGDEEVLITSFTLRAMSGEMEYTFPLKEEAVNADFGEFSVVMLDGSQIRMQSAWHYPNKTTFTFPAPIALEEVSHILLPNGTKIPMP